MNHIAFTKPTESKSTVPRIGGKSFIPDHLWPKDENENVMLFIASIPAETVARVMNIVVAENTFFSIFSTYSREDYFLDKVIYNCNDAEELDIIKQNTQIIYHQKEEAINLSEHEIPAFEFSFSENADEGNFLGGSPEFLQEELVFEDYRFLMQFYAGNFPEEYRDILYLSDAVGYVFIKNELKINKIAGLYFGQCT